MWRMRQLCPPDAAPSVFDLFPHRHTSRLAQMVMMGGTKTLLIDIRKREFLSSKETAYGEASQVGRSNSSTSDLEKPLPSSSSTGEENLSLEELIKRLGNDPAKGREKVVELGLKRHNWPQLQPLISSAFCTPCTLPTILLLLSHLSLISPVLLCQSSTNSATNYKLRT